jgi:hypothetical protein
MKKWYSIIIIPCFFISSAIAQTTVTIAATADNTIYQTPSGNSNALGQNIFSGTNGGGSPRRGLIKFDVAAAIPAGATIVSVTLTLNCNNSRAIADNVSLYKLLSSWGEGTSNAGATGDGAGVAATTNDATWLTTFFPASFWITAGGDYNPVSSATTSINNTGFFTWSSADMVLDVQNWLSTPATNYGWILLCNETAIGTARRFASRENAITANRPSLSVTYSAVLPLTLTGFWANETSNSGVQLDWATAYEANTKLFDIEWGTDGVNFKLLATKKSAGNSSSNRNYNYLHQLPGSGNNYYRLKMTDIDGHYKYSPVIRIRLAGVPDILIMPNPITSQLKLNGVKTGTTILVIDAAGRQVYNGQWNGTTIPVSHWAKGMYTLQVQAEGSVINRKFMKQ